eukprot:jgi/Tetstr1/439760/TSEL_028174.t1
MGETPPAAPLQLPAACFPCESNYLVRDGKARASGSPTGPKMVDAGKAVAVEGVDHASFDPPGGVVAPPAVHASMLCWPSLAPSWEEDPDAPDRREPPLPPGELPSLLASLECAL